MADDLLSRIPAWLKSLYEMENELRDAARNGLILRNEKASQHLAGGRRHLDEVMKQVRGEEPSNGPQTPLRKEGVNGHQGKMRTSELSQRRSAKVHPASYPNARHQRRTRAGSPAARVREVRDSARGMAAAVERHRSVGTRG
jgi:hypothetical protein